MPNEPASSLLAEQVRALETELAETRAAVAEFFQILPLAMLEIDLASLRVTYMNRLARIVLGYDPEAGLPGIAASEIVVPGEYERLLALTMQLYHQGMQPDGTYLRTGKQEIYETTGRRRDGSTFPAEFQSMFVLNADKLPVAARLVFRDISERKAAEAEREHLLQNLQTALANVRTLQGLLPICAWCRKVRDDGGYWSELEAYVTEHSNAEFTHGICPDCLAEYQNRRRMRRPPNR